MLPSPSDIRIPLALASLALVPPDAAMALQTQPASASAVAVGHRVSPRAEPCLRLRIAASTDAATVDCLAPGVRVSVTTRRGDWSWVELASGIEGWVATEYLEQEGAAAPPQAADPTEEAASGTGTSAAAQVEEGSAAPVEPGPTAPLSRDASTAPGAGDREAELTARWIETGARLERAETRVAELIRQLETARQSATDIASEARALRTRNEELAAALKASRQAATAKQEEAARLRSDNQQIRVELDGARQRITALEEELAAARRASSIDSPAAEDQRARSEQLAAELEQQGHRLAAAEARAAKLESQLAAARGQTAAAEARTGELAAELDELRPRTEAAELRAGDLTAAEQQLGDDLDRARRDLAAAAERNSELAEELETLRRRAAAAETTAGDLTASEQRLRGDLERTRRDLAAAEARLAERSTELAEARRQARSEPPDEPPPTPPRPVAIREQLSPAGSIVEQPPPPAQAESTPRRPPEGEAAEAAVAAVRAWAAAWSQQQLDDYLAAYSIAFRPPAELSRLEWEEQRRRRLAAPDYIEVELSELEATVLDPRTVAVRFRQEYRSDRFRDTVRKQLTMALEQGRWKIREEEAAE